MISSDVNTRAVSHNSIEGHESILTVCISHGVWILLFLIWHSGTEVMSGILLYTTIELNSIHLIH